MKTTISLFIALVFAGNLMAQSPGGVAGANLWYKADAGVTASGGTLSKWANQGSMANADAEIRPGQLSTSHPTYNTAGTDLLNFNPSFSFDGINDFIQTGALSNFLAGTDHTLNKEASQFVVYKKLGDGDTHFYNIDNGNVDVRGTIILLGGLTNGKSLQEGFRMDDQNPVAENETVLLDLIGTTSSAAHSLSLNKNGRQNQSGPVNSHYRDNDNVHPLRIGRYLDSYGHFIISELVIFPSSLNAPDRLKVQTYLALKYGLSLGNNENAVDYISSGGTTIWTANATYKFDIFGIGQDNGSGLTQSSSNSMNTGSGDGTGQSGKGNIVLSNPSSLVDGDFLLIGHDNAGLTLQSTDLPASFTQPRLAREWKAKRTSDPGTVTLTFDLTGLALGGNISSATTDFNILIDSDGDGDFSNATATNASTVNGTLLTFNTLTIPDGAVFSFSMELSNTWTGATDTDWATAGNWSGGIPGSSADVTIPDGMSNYPVIGSATNAFCHDLYISNTATLSVEGSLTVSGTVIDSSDASGTGSIIVSGTISTDSVVVERGIFDTNWYIFSAPVAGSNMTDFASVFAEEKTGRYALAPYNESTDAWDYISTTPSGDEFVAGKGYTLKPKSILPRISFSGYSVFSGTVNVSLVRTNFGWNAVGNPYLSSIRANGTNSFASVNSTKLDDTYSGLYFWNHGTADYDIIPSAGTGADVALGQGFIIKAKNNGDEVSFTPDMQVHAIATVFKSGEMETPEIQIHVQSGEHRNTTQFLFPDGATSGLDVGWDVGKLKGNPNIALYSRLVDNSSMVDFAIQALPENYSELVVPLGIDVPAGTEVTFTAAAMNLPADAAVWLEDRSTATFTRLDEADASYITLISENTKGVGNFYLHTKYSVTAADVTETANAYRVLVNRNEGYLRIVTNEAVPGQAKLYDVAGRLHGVLELQQGADNKMYINGKPGVYVIRIAGGEKVFSEKVVWN